MDIAGRLKKLLKGRVVIVGIGNRLRGDDGFGPMMIERLKGRVKSELLDAGSAPENFFGSIIKKIPQTVLILDIADMGYKPGSIDILKKEDIINVGFSTHDASPAAFMKFLESNIDVRIFMIAVQPKNVTFGEGLSDEVGKAIDSLEGIFTKDLRI